MHAGSPRRVSMWSGESAATFACCCYLLQKKKVWYIFAFCMYVFHMENLETELWEVLYIIYEAMRHIFIYRSVSPNTLQNQMQHATHIQLYKWTYTHILVLWKFSQRINSLFGYALMAGLEPTSSRDEFKSREYRQWRWLAGQQRHPSEPNRAKNIDSNNRYLDWYRLQLKRLILQNILKIYN